MNNLQEFYRKIEYLRSNGVKMKEIADWIDAIGTIPYIFSKIQGCGEFH